MTEGHEGREQTYQAGKRPPVEWKIKSMKNEEQTVTILFPAQQEEQAAIPENDSTIKG